jgi:tRNA(adenine34) deaminase
MPMALTQAKYAMIADETPIGAVIINPETQEIISASHNLVEQKQDPTAHAEMLAIQSACHKLNNKSLAGMDIYITLQPCLMCLQALTHAKINRIYFGAYDKKNPIAQYISNHQIEIYGGIYEEECKDLLHQFFHQKRKN